MIVVLLVVLFVLAVSAAVMLAVAFTVADRERHEWRQRKALADAGHAYRYQASYSLLGGDRVAIPTTIEYQERETDAAIALMVDAGYPESLARYIAWLSKPPVS